MIVNDDFIFIHIQKTGGTWLKRGISQSPKHRSKVRIAPHAPLGLLPPEYEHLPAWACVRNPFDWYVSWFEFTHQHIRNRTSIFSVDPSMFTQAHHDAMFLVRTFDAFIREVRPFSEQVRKMIEHPRMQVTLHPMEDGLDKILAEYVPGAQMSPKRINASQRTRGYHGYYTDELREIVEEKDRDLLQQFDYTFD